MNLDELQSVQSRERQASQLQHLRATFYEEVAEYVGELRDERNRVAAASDDPFDDPEVERLTDEIRTVEQTVESIYERRVGKVVKLASIAAAGMSHQESGLTVEEERLFERLVDAIEGNRESVLSVLEGDAPSLDCTPVDGVATETAPDPGTDRASGTGPGDADPGVGTEASEGTGRTDTADPSGPSDPPSPTAPESGVDATAEADPDPVTDAGGERPTPPDRSPAEADPTPAASDAGDAASRGDGEPLDIAGAMGADDGRGPADGPAEDTAPTAPATEPPDATGTDGPDGDRESGGGGTADESGPVERTTVRVTADVGDIFGVDGRSYDLSAEDVVTLPAPNAENLVAREAAERLD